MNNSVRDVLRITFASTLFFLLGLFLFGYYRETHTAGDKLEYSRLYVEAFKIIVISFFVALIGILVPARLREVQLGFERSKESRIAYSKAKTGVAYLPLQICSLNFAGAVDFIQRVHFEKHQAELYSSDLEKYVEHLGVDAGEWGEEHYQRLFAYRTVLEKLAGNWDSTPQHERIELLLKARADDQVKRKEHHKKDTIG